MENEQEKIVTTPSENNDGSGFEIVKTEPLSEQDAAQGYSWKTQIVIDPSLTPDEIKQAMLNGTMESTGGGKLFKSAGQGDNAVIISNGRVEGELVITPTTSMLKPSKGVIVKILDPKDPKDAEEIAAHDRAEVVHDLSDGPAGTTRRIDRAEAILGSFTGNLNQQAQMDIRAPEGQTFDIDVSEVGKHGPGNVLVDLSGSGDVAVISETLPNGTKKTTYYTGENESMTEFETPQVSEAEKGWNEAQGMKEEMAAAATPLDDSEYQARKQQHANAARNEVQQYTRARGSAALAVNKFVLDGTSYPGDVVVGWAERHTPIRWCDPKDVDTDQINYLPCKPALKTTNPTPGVVAIKRKSGKLILLCGHIDLRVPFKAHVFNENQLTKGKLADSLTLARLWDNGGMELQKAAADAASVVQMQPGRTPGKMAYVKELAAEVDKVKQGGRAPEMTHYQTDFKDVDLSKS